MDIFKDDDLSSDNYILQEVISINDISLCIRVDKFLAERFPDYSRSYFQDLIKSNNILVNHKSIKSNYVLKFNDELFVSIPTPVSLEILPENLHLDILFEDNDVIIVNKPKGMVVHPANGHFEHTLVNGLLYHCSDLSGINGVMRPGIVHRIDMNTTGSLIVCKNDISHRIIAEQIAVHSVNRIYEGIVIGKIDQDEGIIDYPIGRDEKDRKKMAATYKNSKEAITHYKVLKRFKDYTYVQFKLETGRTHQIRVHMAHIGHPLLGDEVYGPKKCPYKLQGQTLHAKTIGFVHPTSQEYVEFSAPLPDYFEHLLGILPE